MRARAYFLAVTGATLGLVAAAWGLTWWLQPLCGDLTRIGGHAERHFGWNSPQAAFNPLASGFGPWNQPADLLVIGDSFANLTPPVQWQNWLATLTGWRIHTLDQHKIDIADLIDSPLYRQHPPQVVVWNSVERDLAERADPAEPCPGITSGRQTEPLLIRPQATQSSPWPRPHGWEALNPGFAPVWLWRELTRRVLHWETSDSLVLALGRNGLFSAAADDKLLIYRQDLINKMRWTAFTPRQVRCGFSRLARQFEANGVTRFVTALAPDKSSAYRPWLADPSALPAARLAEVLDGFPVPDARLDRVLGAAIAAATQDVYLPNDTHWGTPGHRLAAQAVLDLLIKEGLAS
jgi:hypothetical protein